MLINDPHTSAKIDVTGWDLDYLADHIATVRADRAAGSQRPLSADEINTLEHDRLGLPTGNDDWWTTDVEVGAAVESVGAVVLEAIHQRDLGLALTTLATGYQLRPGTGEWLAYDRYVREIAEKP